MTTYLTMPEAMRELLEGNCVMHIDDLNPEGRIYKVINGKLYFWISTPPQRWNTEKFSDGLKSLFYYSSKFEWKLVPDPSAESPTIKDVLRKIVDGGYWLPGTQSSREEILNMIDQIKD